MSKGENPVMEQLSRGVERQLARKKGKEKVSGPGDPDGGVLSFTIVFPLGGKRKERRLASQEGFWNQGFGASINKRGTHCAGQS